MGSRYYAPPYPVNSPYPSGGPSYPPSQEQGMPPYPQHPPQPPQPPPSQPPTQAPSQHALRQPLTSLLGQSGQQALPYDENLKCMIREQVAQAVEHYPDLKYAPSLFTHNDGRAAQILQLTGTIPVWYKGAKYNIPVAIWLLEPFPRSAPLVYVTPTRDMIIRPRHSHVDPSGLVDIPYIREWVFQQSSLHDLIQLLCVAFSQETPLYSRPPSSSPDGVEVRPGEGPPPAVPPKDRLLSRENPEEVFRRNAIRALTAQLQKDVVETCQEASRKVDCLLGVQQLLEQRQGVVQAEVGELHKEKAGLEQALQACLTQANALESWLAHNDRAPEAVDPDSIFVPADALSRQLLDSISSDLAIEDTMYVLDRALQDEIGGGGGRQHSGSAAAGGGGQGQGLSTEQYLRQVRSLARDQFFFRALELKIRAAQFSARVAHMAALGSSSSAAARPFSAAAAPVPGAPGAGPQGPPVGAAAGHHHGPRGVAPSPYGVQQGYPPPR